MAWTRRTEMHHSLWALCGELNLLAKMHWSCELWLLMLSSSSMYSPLRFHWLRNKGVQVSVCFFTKYRVSEDSRAGKRLRLILVLRETNVESGPAESSTTTLIEGFLLWEWCLFMDLWGAVWLPQKAERDYAILKMAARHCVSLTKVHVSHGEFSKVHICKKFSFFVEGKTSSCVSKSKSWTLWPKSLTEIHKRTATWNVEIEMKNKKKE